MKQITQNKFEPLQRNKEPLTRHDLVSLKDIRNIKDKVKESSRFDSDANKSLEKIVEKWVKEADYNPILIFKPELEEMKIGPLEELSKIDNFNLKDEKLFIFGYQTEAQANMMKKGMDGMWFVDCTHGTYIKDYQLMDIIVLNGDRKGYPIALFLISEVNSATVAACVSSLKFRNKGYCPKVLFS